MTTLPPHAQSGNTPKYKVYRLVDPRNHVPFYDGITLNLYERFKQHMSCDGTNVLKDEKVQEILEDGFLPIMEIVEQVDTFEHAIEREGYWIRHDLDRGLPLLNVSIAAKHQSREIQARQRKYDEIIALLEMHHAGNNLLWDKLDVQMQRYFRREYPEYFGRDNKDNREKRQINKAKAARIQRERRV